MDKLLRKYNSTPSQAGIEWAQKYWRDEDKVVERTELCRIEQKIKEGKGKGIVCAVLGACLSCAQKEIKTSPSPERIADVEYASLKSENEVLKTSLTLEREENEKLKTSLTLEKENNEKLGTRVDSLMSDNQNLNMEIRELKLLVATFERREKQLQENLLNFLLDQMPSSVSAKQVHKLIHCADPETWDGDIWNDNDNDELVADSVLTPKSVPMRPLIKNKTTDEGDDDVCTMVHTIPWSPAELAKLQEKYSRHLEESETEYVWRVSLTGGDRILLSEVEAEGYWGPGVFLTTTPGDHNYSLTMRAANWAGSIDPQDRGEPLVIKTSGFSDLVVSVQKAACIQAMYERDMLRRSPMLAPVDPAQLTPLIRGLPDSLKTYVASVQDRIRATQEASAGPYHARRAGRPNYRNQQIPTWNEFVQELVSYGRRMGWIEPTTGKTPQPPPRRVRQVRSTKLKPECTPKFDKERNDLWRRALAMGVPRQILYGTPTTDLRALVHSLSQRINSAGSSQTTGKKPIPARSVPSAPQHNLIDLTDTPAAPTKNLHPRGGQ
ncbi:uncharacterized protein LOC142601014 [Balearica regulorum gibbericeps]|uniref:uncharacterized protein LOC142601014 n=1 Tax=Balearica regulorum gibbericeps TaxID=100784 RepID=UPI003F62D126